MPKKIYIIGSVGSGKSTLARHISSKLNIPYYELDNVVWRRVEHGNFVQNDQNSRNPNEKRRSYCHPLWIE